MKKLLILISILFLYNSCSETGEDCIRHNNISNDSIIYKSSKKIDAISYDSDSILLDGDDNMKQSIFNFWNQR